MTEQAWLDIFGDNLNELLSEAGMNQADLAEATGLSTATISYYINKRKMPGPRALVNIATALNVSLDDLMDFGDMIM